MNEINKIYSFFYQGLSQAFSKRMSDVLRRMDTRELRAHVFLGPDPRKITLVVFLYK